MRIIMGLIFVVITAITSAACGDQTWPPQGLYDTCTPDNDCKDCSSSMNARNECVVKSLN